MTPQEELELRKRQLDARRGKPGLSANVADLEKRIAELEALING
jgi:hypothetical protein